MARNVLWQCDKCGFTTHDTTDWIEMHQFTPGRPTGGWATYLVS